ncbi:glycosyltransferase family 9 protein [Sphaerisporangium aureirubrum]|uniref:glycosyltransferase family 9 protein n=1 Tax=Sphaerisporangium aureirubrum TaxID=1544736 RepID=UPI003625EA85
MEHRPVLVALRGLGMGGLLTAVPALRGLRRAYPGHRILLAAPAALSGLLPLMDAVDALLDVSGPGPVPYDRPDIAVNLHGGGPRSTLALLRTRPGRLLTHAHPGVPHAGGPPWDPEPDEVTRWCALLGWYGVPADPADLSLPVPPATAAGHVIVHPGAASPARRWPPERFAQVVAALGRAGHRVLLTGGPAERALALRLDALSRASGSPVAEVAAGRTDVAALAELVGAARLVVCGDTGVAHLATALGTPSVVLFGPASPARGGRPRRDRHIALWAGRTGDPHGLVPDPGLLEIGVPEVLEAVLTLLAADAGRAGDGDGARPETRDGPGARREEADGPVTVTLCEDGPLLVRGPFTIVTQDGRTVDQGRAAVALCRCGRSAIKPFCDGSHKTTGFRAPGAPGEGT